MLPSYRGITETEERWMEEQKTFEILKYNTNVFETLFPKRPLPKLVSPPTIKKKCLKLNKTSYKPVIRLL